MKILFSVFRYHTNMVSLIQSLKNAGHDVLILALAQEPYEDYSENLVRLIDQECDFEAQVFELLEEFDPDAVVVRDALNESVAPMVTRLAKSKKISCISYEQNPCYANSFWSATLAGYRHFVHQIQKGLPVKEMSPTIGSANGYPIPFRKFFRFPMRSYSNVKYRGYFPDGVIRILTVGKLGVERKRLHWVINALESFNVSYQLTIVGANDLDRYRDRSVSYYEMLYERTKLGRVAGYVKILENVPFEEMGSIYQSCDIFVLPAKDEKFGISPLEAMSYGCAVLCADDNGSTPYLTSGVNSLVFKTNSYEDFSSKLFTLVFDKQLTRQLGAAGAEAISQKHSLRSFENFLSNLLKSRR